MFAGNMMIPEPIMFTATITVSCVSVIFFFLSSMFYLACYLYWSPFANDLDQQSSTRTTRRTY
jgi:hypothetical protein